MSDVQLVLISAVLLSAFVTRALYLGLQSNPAKDFISQIKDGDLVEVFGHISRIDFAPREHLLEGQYAIWVSAAGIPAKELAAFTVTDGTGEVLVRVGPGAVHLGWGSDLDEKQSYFMSFPRLSVGQRVLVSGLARWEPDQSRAGGYRDVQGRLVLTYAGDKPLRVLHRGRGREWLETPLRLSRRAPPDAKQR